MQDRGYSPPSVFGTLEDGIYRSNSPTEQNLPFLASLELRTVLYLSPDVLLRRVSNFITENNIVLHNLGLQAWRPEVSWTPISQELIKDALEIVLNRDNHPLLVCCTSGIYQTGTLVGCLRRLQNWTMTSLLDEYRIFAGNKARVMHEQFIELFDVDLVTLPQNLPQWFIAQRELQAIEIEELEQLDALDPEPTPGSIEAKRKHLLKLYYDSPGLISSPAQYTSGDLVDDEDDD